MISRQQVIIALERHEVPYIGWHRDYPDLYDDYFRRLSVEQQATANWFNSMSDADFERYKSAVRYFNPA